MKKKKLTLLSAVTAAAIMAACTADEMLSEGGKATRSIASADPTPIMVSALVDDGDWEDEAVGSDELHPVGTRAAQTLNEGSLSGTVQSMALYAYGQSGNASGYSRFVLDSYNSSTQLFSATTMPVFPAGDNSVNVYGWYPAMDTTPKTFVVQQDQSTDANFIKSDLMLANQVSCTRSKNSSNEYTVTAAELTFSHVLSKINMNITPGEGVTITQVVINGVNRTATIDDSSPAALTATCSGSGSEAITVYSGSYNTTSSALQISAVIPPQTLTNTFVTITANTPTKTSKTATYSLGSTGKFFDTGKKYEMNLTVNQQDIKPQAHNISAWDNAGTVTIEGNTTGGGGDIELSEYEKTFTYGDADGTVTISSGSGTYTAVSSNTDVATASVSGTSITINPNVTVNKATTAVTTAPTMAGTLTFNGNAQNLITANGVAANGTMQYSKDNSIFASTIPTATNAGSYNLYYRAYQDNTSDYTGTTASVNLGSVSIDQLTFQTSNSNNNGYLTIASIGEQIHTGNAITPTPAITVKLSSGNQTLTSGTDFTYSYSNNTDLGTNSACVIVTGMGNYKGSASANFSIVTCDGHALSSAVIGDVICSHGKAHTATTSALKCGGTKVAVVGYKNGSSGYAIALVNSDNQTWNDITNNGANENVDCTLADGKRGSVPVAPTGTTWKVLNKANYEAMFIAMGSTTGDYDGKTYDANVNNKITAAGGTALSGGYWSSSEADSDRGWYFFSRCWGNGSIGTYTKSNSSQVRPCLAW